MRSCWSYDLLGVGDDERVYACRAGVVYSSRTTGETGWSQHRDPLPPCVIWFTDQSSENLMSPEEAVFFVLRCEGSQEDES